MFNFHRLSNWRKNFNSENFLICGTYVYTLGIEGNELQVDTLLVNS